MKKHEKDLTDAIIHATTGKYPDKFRSLELGIMPTENRKDDGRLVWLWMPDGKFGDGYQMIYRINEIVELRDTINRFLMEIRHDRR